MLTASEPNRTMTQHSESKTDGDLAVKASRLVGGLEDRHKKLEGEYQSTTNPQEQSIIAGQLIELAGIICLMKQTLLSR